MHPVLTASSLEMLPMQLETSSFSVPAEHICRHLHVESIFVLLLCTLLLSVYHVLCKLVSVTIATSYTLSVVINYHSLMHSSWIV